MKLREARVRRAHARPEKYYLMATVLKDTARFGA